MKNLLLLHGALGSKAQLESLKTLLSNKYKVYSLNFEGHGGRQTDKEFSIELFAENARQFITENKLEKVDIFGYSMGGYVALTLAKNNPGLVGKIVTLATKFDWTTEAAEKEVKMLNPEKIEAKVPAFAQRLDELHGKSDWKTVLRKTAQMMLDLGAGKCLKDEELQQINHHSLIAIGTLDKMVSQAESSQAATNLPNGNLMLVENFKHPIEKVDKEQLANIIKGFL